MKNYKQDFPIFKNNPGLVYLDSAATSQKPQVVLDALNDYYRNYNSNIRRGLYPIAEKATQKVEEARKKVAQFIHAKDSSEIIFVRNTTEAINLVVNTWGDGNVDREDYVVTTIMEHHSNFVPWQQLAKIKGAKFEAIDIDDNFQFSIFNFQLNLKIKKAKLLALTHVSNVLGTINPVKEIIKEVRKINPDIKVLVDGAQAVSHLKVDVLDLDADFYAFSGHKMMASTGIGVLYGKKKLLEEMAPFLFGGEMVREVTLEETTFANVPFKFEAGTPDIAGIISLGAAIEYLNTTGIENVQNHEKELMEYCLSKLEKIEGLKMYGPKDLGKRLGLISFTMEGVHPHDISQVLGDMGVCIRAGHHCAQPLHARLGIPASARISLYLYNDKEDIDKLVKGIKKVKEIFQV